MAQSRFTKYQDPINSLPLNEKYVGILEPSVYKGFDAIQSRAGLNITLNHTTTGELFTNLDGTQTPRRGVWLTRQGVVVKEDANITVAITPNPNNFERWDILVGEHLHDELNPGGLPAGYVVLPGTNQTEPTLPNPESQVIIGRIRVPANATSTAAVVWERRAIPSLGGKFPALLLEDNRYSAQNQENQSTASISTQSLELANRRVILALTGGNSFIVSHTGSQLDLLPNKPAGTLISLTFNNDIEIRGYSNQLSSNVPAGYSQGLRPIILSASVPGAVLSIKAWELVTLRMVDSGSSHASRVPAQQYWELVSITDTFGKILDVTTRMTVAESKITALESTVNNPSTGVTALNNKVNAHTGNTSNPHNVTKTQVGLGNIPNAISNNPQANDGNILATTVATAALYAILSGINGVPQGVILMWSGSTATIPTGWALCDGNNGTPDLRSRFVMGASESPRDTGNPLPPDQAGLGGGETLKKDPGNQGGKFDTTLLEANVPSHSHKMFDGTGLSGSGNELVSNSIVSHRNTDNGNAEYTMKGRVGVGAQTLGNTSSYGGSTPFTNLPPYIVLAYIMKL